MSLDRAIVAALLTLAGCVVEMDTERPGSPIGGVERDCVVPVDVDRGAPAAIEDAAGSLWMFDDGAAAYLPRGADPCADGLDLWPAPLLELTAEEQQANAERTDGRALAVRARAGVVSGATTWIYYDLLLRGPGFFDEERVATGTCALTSRPGTCVRSPQMLWPGAGRDWGDAALIVDDTAYVLGCDHAAAFTDLCALARVAPSALEAADAYQYLGWNDAWQATDRDTVTLFEAPATVSASQHAPSGRTLVTIADIWTSRLMLRSAPRASGGYADPVVLFDVASPPDWFFGGGREHAGLRSTDGRTLVFSYHTAAAPAPGLHLVRFRLDGDEVTPW